MNQSTPSLYWLPIHDDFAAAMRAAKGISTADERLRALVDLSGYRRDFVQTGKIDRLEARSVRPSFFLFSQPLGRVNVTLLGPRWAIRCRIASRPRQTGARVYPHACHA